MILLPLTVLFSPFFAFAWLSLVSVPQRRLPCISLLLNALKETWIILPRIHHSFYLYVYIYGYVINVFLPHYTENTTRTGHLSLLSITDSPVPNVINRVATQQIFL